jgi:hypothetical protein
MKAGDIFQIHIKNEEDRKAFVSLCECMVKFFNNLINPGVNKWNKSRIESMKLYRVPDDYVSFNDWDHCAGMEKESNKPVKSAKSAIPILDIQTQRTNIVQLLVGRGEISFEISKADILAHIKKEIGL